VVSVMVKLVSTKKPKTTTKETTVKKQYNAKLDNRPVKTVPALFVVLLQQAKYQDKRQRKVFSPCLRSGT